MVAHTPETIHAWVAQLRQRSEGHKVALCPEQRQGALIDALCQYDFIVLFPVNPQTVAQYRRAFTPSGAKDDPTDACILLELLLKHQDKLTAWTPASPQMRELHKLVEWRRQFVDDGMRLAMGLSQVLEAELCGVGRAVTAALVLGKGVYDVHKRKGKTHHAAIRALAFKWVRILWRCWQDRKPYDEAKDLLALKKNQKEGVATGRATRPLDNFLTAVSLRAYVS